MSIKCRKTYPVSYRRRFSANLQKKMQENHLTQAEIARKLGVTRASVCYWVHGVSIPSGENLKMLAKLLETSPKRLLGYTLGEDDSEDIWMNFLEAEKPKICRKSKDNPWGVV